MAIENRPYGPASSYVPMGAPPAAPANEQVMYSPGLGVDAYGAPGGPAPAMQASCLSSPLRAIWQRITSLFHRNPQPGYQQPGYPQPGYPQPSYPQPGYPQPVYQQPAYPQPAYPQPAYPQPVYAPPAYPPVAYPPVNPPGAFPPGQLPPGIYQPVPGQPGAYQPLPPAPVDVPPPPPPAPPVPPVAPAPLPPVAPPPPAPVGQPGQPVVPPQTAAELQQLEREMANIQKELTVLQHEVDTLQHPGAKPSPAPGVRPAPAPAPAPSPAPGPHPQPRHGHGPEIHQGAIGHAVRQVQERLHQLGYYNGPINGKFGKSTDQAVRRFQAHEHIAVDGDVGKQTWNHLGIVGVGQVRYPHPGAKVRAALEANLNNPYKGVVHQCFRYAWATATGAGGKGIDSAFASHDGRGHAITYLADMAASGRLHVGDVVYVNRSPGADPSSTNLAYGPHWFVYIGQGQYADQYGVKQSAAEMQAFVPGRVIDTIYHTF